MLPPPMKAIGSHLRSPDRRRSVRGGRIPPCRRARGRAFGIAASRSPLMPIDSVSSRWPAAFSRPAIRAAAETAPLSPRSAPAAGCTSVRAAQPRQGRAPRPRVPATVRRCDAALAGLVGQPAPAADLQWRRVIRPLRAQARATRSRSTVCTHSKSFRDSRVLLACSCPMKCQASRQVAQCVDLGQRFLNVVLAESRSVRPPPAARTAAAGCCLLTATSRTTPGRDRTPGWPRVRCGIATAASAAGENCGAINILGSEALLYTAADLRDPSGLRIRRAGSRERPDGSRHRAAAGVRRQEQRVRPAPVGGRAADDSRRRRHEAHQHAAR